MNSDIRLVDMELSFQRLPMRTPLKFGTGVSDKITSLVVEATVENRCGQVAVGLGNILLSSLWGYPSAIMSPEQLDTAMRTMAERFCQFMLENAQFGHPMDLFLEAKAELPKLSAQVDSDLSSPDPMPLLGALVCASPVDAALTDGFGKANGICSYDGYSTEFMAHDLSRWCGADFAGKYPGDYLHSAYKSHVPIFHLVGGLDKLTASEVTDEDPQDGLPVSLDQWIERDGIRCFKVKLRGNDTEWDIQRTADIARVVQEAYDRLGITDRFYLSTDSNEMNPDPQSVLDYLHGLRGLSPEAFDALLYLEQPTERDLTASRFDMSEVAAIKPVVVDEGVTSVEMMDLAIELGWSGVGLKTCKSHSASLLYLAKAMEQKLVLTFQDLTNPGLSLVHEAGFAARIDTLMGFEYNSRQYLPYAHPEIKALHEPLFAVRDGQVSTETIADVGLGYGR
jgi:L-alanine-DL-glutamate epimerase-like enolase superfamily enzyme